MTTMMNRIYSLFEKHNGQRGIRRSRSIPSLLMLVCTMLLVSQLASALFISPVPTNIDGPGRGSSVGGMHDDREDDEGVVLGDVLRIKLFSPPNGAVLSTSTITFSYIVSTDDRGDVSCRLLTDIYTAGLAASSAYELVSSDGTIHSFVLEDVLPGTYQWSVQCRSSLGTVFATPWTFTVDYEEEPEEPEEEPEEENTPPIVGLVSPPSGLVLMTLPVTMVYTVSDEDDSVQCQLFFGSDSVLTAASDSEEVSADGVAHAFEIDMLMEDMFSWTVECTDSGGLSTRPPYRTFTFEQEEVHESNDKFPDITLIYPGNDAVLSESTVPFSFSVSDEDESVACDVLVAEEGETLETIVSVSAETTDIPSSLLSMFLSPVLERDRFMSFPRGFLGSPLSFRDPSKSPYATDASVSTRVTVPGFSEGQYQWAVRCRDSQGHEARARPSSFTIDFPEEEPDTQEPPQRPVIVIEEEELPFHWLIIKSIRLVGSPGLDEAVVGEDVLMAITLKNDAPRDFEDLHVALLIEGAGIRRMIGPFDLRRHEQVTKFVQLDLPSETRPGKYTVRVTVSNDEIRRVKHRDVDLFDLFGGRQQEQ